MTARPVTARKIRPERPRPYRRRGHTPAVERQREDLTERVVCGAVCVLSVLLVLVLLAEVGQ